MGASYVSIAAGLTAFYVTILTLVLIVVTRDDDEEDN